MAETIDVKPTRSVVWGVTNNQSEEGTEYFVRFKFTAKDVKERPLERVQEMREDLLELFGEIQSQWLPELAEETKCLPNPEFEQK